VRQDEICRAGSNVTDLHAVFEFDEADLAANRLGQLSARQRERLARLAHEERADQGAARLSLLVIAALFAAYFLIVPPLGDSLGPFICLVIAGWFAALCGIGYGSYRLARLLLRRRPVTPLADASVIPRTGRLSQVDDGEHLHLMLADAELQSNVDAVEDARLWELEPDAVYTLYFFGAYVVAVERACGSKPQSSLGKRAEGVPGTASAGFSWIASGFEPGA
jgi:hypothetical protein